MTSEEFRVELKALGLSQRALAMRLGLAVTTVNRWALEQVPVPQYAVAYLELRRALAEISRRLVDAGLAKPTKAPAARRVARKPKRVAAPPIWGKPQRHISRYWEDEAL